jgi:hypothetical protein
VTCRSQAWQMHAIIVVIEPMKEKEQSELC